jgi:hypothetical protein
MTDVTPPPAPPTTPVWEDFIDLFTSPSKVFERRREDPTFFVPLLVVTVVVGLIMFGTKDLMSPIFDAEFAKGMAKAQAQNPAMTEAQMETAKSFARTIATFGGFIIIPIAIALLGIVTFAAGKIVSATTTFAQAMMVAAFAYVPRIVASVVAAVIAAVMDPASLNSQFAIQVGPARFLDPATTSMPLLVVLGRFELFTLWSTALVIIGLKVTGKLDTTKATIAGVIVWAIATILPLLGALRG